MANSLLRPWSRDPGYFKKIHTVTYTDKEKLSRVLIAWTFWALIHPSEINSINLIWNKPDSFWDHGIKYCLKPIYCMQQKCKEIVNSNRHKSKANVKKKCLSMCQNRYIYLYLYLFWYYFSKSFINFLYKNGILPISSAICYILKIINNQTGNWNECCQKISPEGSMFGILCFLNPYRFIYLFSVVLHI